MSLALLKDITGLRVKSIHCGSCQTLWVMQQEGIWHRRWGERSHKPDPSGTGSVEQWRRTGPKTNPEILQGPKSTDPLLQTEEEKETKMNHVQGFRKLSHVSATFIFLCTLDQNYKLLISVSEKFTCTSECVWSIWIRHPKPTPNSMSEGNLVKDGQWLTATVIHFHNLCFYTDTRSNIKIRILKMMPPKQADMAIRG